MENEAPKPARNGLRLPKPIHEGVTKGGAKVQLFVDESSPVAEPEEEKPAIPRDAEALQKIAEALAAKLQTNGIAATVAINDRDLLLYCANRKVRRAAWKMIGDGFGGLQVYYEQARLFAQHMKEGM